MGIRSLTALKKDHTQAKEVIKKKYLVLGQEPIAAFVVDHLSKKEVDFSWLGEKDLDVNELANVSPSLLRSKESVEAIEEFLPSLELQKVDKTPQFYKDQKFREFGGRAKPLPLKKYEDFYLENEWAYYNHSQLLTENIKENLKDNNNFQKVFIDYVEYAEGVWRVRLKDEREFQAEEIVWCDEPANFLKQFRKKSLFNAEEIESLESHAYIQSMCLELSGERDFFKESQVLIVPKSLTHDWGHFVLEFKEKKFHVLSYIEEKNSAPEEAEKEWRHLHSTLKRVLIGYKQDAFKEEIFVGKLPCLNFENAIELTEESLLRKCHFVNAGAPLRNLELEKNSIGYSHEKLFGLARSVVSFELFKTESPIAD